MFKQYKYYVKNGKIELRDLSSHFNDNILNKKNIYKN